MSKALLRIVCFVLASCSVAFADPVTTYIVNGSGPTLTGTVTINSRRGYIVLSDLTVTTSQFTEQLSGGGGGQNGMSGFSLSYFTSNDFYQLLLTSPNFDGTLKGFSGGTFFFSDADGLADVEGTLDPQAPTPSSTTPEPASLALLSTGLLALAGATRKRFLP